MPIYLILIAIGAGAYAIFRTSGGNSGGNMSSSSGANPFNLPDVDPSLQGGSYSRDYDSSFMLASALSGVPFALLKAHAIRESSLKPQANHFDSAASGTSYGLLQVEWGGTKYNKVDRFAKAPYNLSADEIGDGSILYDPDLNCKLGAMIIAANLKWLKNNLRDSINAYNTGHAESKGEAPANYVDDVMGYYSELVGKDISNA